VDIAERSSAADGKTPVAVAVSCKDYSGRASLTLAAVEEAGVVEGSAVEALAAEALEEAVDSPAVAVHLVVVEQVEAGKL
jgi:hypothetical protein